MKDDAKLRNITKLYKKFKTQRKRKINEKVTEKKKKIKRNQFIKKYSRKQRWRRKTFK